MSNFIKAEFSFEGNSSEVWVKYNREVIARFKCARAKSNAKDFVKFLVANYSVEEYAEKRESLAPLQILKEKGYQSLNMRKAIEAGNYLPS